MEIRASEQNRCATVVVEPNHTVVDQMGPDEIEDKVGFRAGSTDSKAAILMGFQMDF